MSEEFEIESFEDLIDVFENTGDFGKYYLGDYSNIQIANYLRKMQQENKQLKSILTELEEWLKERYDICEKHLNEMTHDREFYLSAMNVNADRKDTLDKIQELRNKYEK